MSLLERATQDHQYSEEHLQFLKEVGGRFVRGNDPFVRRAFVQYYLELCTADLNDHAAVDWLSDRARAKLDSYLEAEFRPVRGHLSPAGYELAHEAPLDFLPPLLPEMKPDLQ